jgi:tripartite motif-containing protein 71
MHRTRVVLVIACLALNAPCISHADPPAFQGSWGSNGNGPGQFTGPVGIAVAQDGSILVADGVSRIQRFSTTGQYLGEWGPFGTGQGEFNNPVAIATDATGNIYITDALNQRVQKFSPSGTFLLSWGSSGLGDGQFQLPRGIAVGPNGHVYVVDNHLCRVSEFTADGGFVANIGHLGYGGNPGELSGPSDIAISAQGDLYVADTGFHRVQRFDSAGNSTGLYDFDTIARGATTSLPFGVAIIPTGDLVATDYGNNRVIELTADGLFVQAWGSFGSGPSQFSSPFGIAAGSDGAIYVADLYNPRVDKFGAPPTPTRHSTWGHIKARFR